jgi:hypothetical protein
MVEIARIDLLDGQDNEHVDGAELPVDDGAIADEGAQPKIPFDQWRQGLEGCLDVHLFFRKPIHRHVEAVVGAHPPLFRRQRRVMQERQRHGMVVGIVPLEAGTADHHVDPVFADIGPQAVPEQLDGALVAVRFEHA